MNQFQLFIPVKVSQPIDKSRVSLIARQRGE